jgi:hypothetical protein
MDFWFCHPGSSLIPASRIIHLQLLKEIRDRRTIQSKMIQCWKEGQIHLYLHRDVAGREELWATNFVTHQVLINFI